MATTRNDKLMYVVLVGAIVAGLWATLVFNGIKAGSAGYDYRATVAPGSARSSRCVPTSG